MRSLILFWAGAYCYNENVRKAINSVAKKCYDYLSQDKNKSEVKDNDE